MHPDETGGRFRLRWPRGGLLTEDGLPAELMLGLGDAYVDTTVIGGRVLMRHGALVGINEDAVVSRALSCASRIGLALR